MELALPLIILILFLIIFSKPISAWVEYTKDTIVDIFEGPEGLDAGTPAATLPAASPPAGPSDPPSKTVDSVSALGYDPSLSWNDVLAQTELDPGTHESHKEFVKDVQIFSTGPARYSSVADDNTSTVFTHFQGLRRPEHVEIGSGARSVPDLDTDVLKRSRPFRF